MREASKFEPMVKTILISGCTKGIGLAIVYKFASNGFNVAGCARNKEDLTELFKKLSVKYPKQKFFFESCDVANKSALTSFAQDALKEFNEIEILVNNAGIYLPGMVQDEADGNFELIMATNVNSAYHLTRAILPAMQAQKHGHIFNICSTASIMAYPNGGSYSISKYAMMGLNQVLRAELKNQNIKVTAIIPGATFTHSWHGTDLPEERFLPASDIAKLVWAAYDLSDNANVEEILIRPVLGDI